MESFERAVALFATAHQNVGKKNICASVSEEIRRQMENVKSHILTNGGKLNNLAKCTREHAETRFRGSEANHSKVKLENEEVYINLIASLGFTQKREVLKGRSLFSLARQNIENRLKSEAEMKNSSEILACVSKEMENIKSHFLTDGNYIKVKLERDF